MNNNFFYKLGRFLKNHPIISIIIFAGVMYFIFSDSNETKIRKNTCIKVYGLKKNTSQYEDCYKNEYYYLAYGFMNRIVRNKQDITNYNQAVQYINNIKIEVNHNQYRTVDLDTYLKNNFISREVGIPKIKKDEKESTKYDIKFDYMDLKPVSDKVYNEKVSFLVNSFRINTQKIEDSSEKFYSIRLSENLYESRLSNFRIEHKIFPDSDFSKLHYHLDKFSMEYSNIQAKPLARVFGTFQKKNDRFFPRGAFYIDDVIFIKNNLDDKKLYEITLKNHIASNRIKNEDIDKFLKLVNQELLFKKLSEVKPQK